MIDDTTISIYSDEELIAAVEKKMQQFIESDNFRLGDGKFTGGPILTAEGKNYHYNFFSGDDTHFITAYDKTNGDPFLGKVYTGTETNKKLLQHRDLLLKRKSKEKIEVILND